MRLLPLLCLGASLMTVQAVFTVNALDVSPDQTQATTRGGGAGVNIKGASGSDAAGTLALRANFPIYPNFDLIGGRHSIIVQQGTVVSLLCTGATTLGWSFFIPYVNLIFENQTAVQPGFFAENRAEDLQDIGFHPSFDFNMISAAPVSGIGALAPRGRGIVSEDGKILVVNLQQNVPNPAITSATIGDFRLKAAVQYEMIVPQRFLSPNPEFPEQMVSFLIGFVETALITIPVPFQLFAIDFLAPLEEVIVPLTYTTPELALSSYALYSATPSSTIQGEQLTSLVLVFQLGLPLHAGEHIGFEVNQNIFASVPNPNTWPYLSVGYDCNGANGGRLCCSQSAVITRPQGNGGIRAIYAPAPGWSTMMVRLGPKGCMIPHDKRVTLVIPITFLGSNPLIPNSWTVPALGNTAQLVAPVTFGVALAVNLRMFTSSEPHPVNLQRLGEPRHPFSNAIAITPATAGTYADWLIQRQFFFEGISWTSWVIGASTVRGFSAQPSTTITNVIPEWVKFSFTLNSVNIQNRSSATVNGVIISANQGVFRPNQGRLDAPNPVVSGTFPNACRNARWFTNAYGTLVILLNPLFDVQALSDSAQACAAVLVSNALIQVTIPSEAFLPNLATGQWVYFDIRLVDPFMDNSLKLFTFYPTGGWLTPHINSVDTATLMMQNGWFTTASCGISGTGFTPGLVTDLYALSVSDRCTLVCAIAAISPVSFGLLQCPPPELTANALNMVSYLKVPEAAPAGYNWPWSWVANVQYPVLVSIPNTVPVRILNFGYIIDSPMFAVVVSYPATSFSLRSLGVNPAVPASWTLLLVIRMDRMTQSCQKLLTNPWSFNVITDKSIVQCLFFPSTGTNPAGVPLEYVTWGARYFQVPADGAVVCWTAVVASPTPEEDGSDDALFGLLALIAIPILLCYCLLALLWLCRPKREPPCCGGEPVNEVYWVNTVQQQPLYVFDSAATAAPGGYIVG